MKPDRISKSNIKQSSTGKKVTQRNDQLREKNKTFAIKDTFPTRGNATRTSLIPKLKINNNEAKGVERNFGKNVKPSKINSDFSALNTRNDFSSISQNNTIGNKRAEISNVKNSPKNQETRSQPTSQKMRTRQPHSPDIARRLTSDPQVFTKIPAEDKVLFDFENNIRQISELWLKTSADLSDALKILKTNQSLDPMEFQQESMKIQMAIQQAKSLTVLKSKSVMAEAKILLQSGETMESDVEYFFHDRMGSETKGSPLSEKDCQTNPAEKQKFGAMGDLPRKNCDFFKESDGTNFEEENSGSQTTRIEKADSFLLRKTGQSPRQDSEQNNDTITLEIISQELMNELSKKNETITNLNRKVFQLQKTCEEHLQLRNCLQIKLAEYHEKIQWNHVLWKQIGKLKGRIKEFQERHTNLETEKSALEARIANQEKEIEGLTKLNHLLNQKKFLLLEQQNFRGKTDESVTWENGNTENKKVANKKILEEKQNSINVLKMVLNVMVDQENLAQKQIAMFQSKIEELEKAVKV